LASLKKKKMKRWSFIILVLTVLVPFAVQAQLDCLDNCGRAADIRGIQDNFSKQVDCWNRGDLDCYVEAYAPDGTIQTVSRFVVTQGLEGILRQYKRYFPKEKMGQLAFDQFQYTRLSRNYYYVVGHFQLVLKEKEKPFQGWFSVLMKRRSAKWYIVSDHSG
jgi:D-alanyl-D-alanine carboxypeptidase